MSPRDIEVLLCVYWLNKVVLLVHCCVIGIYCIYGSALYPVSCRTLFRNSAHYPAGTVVTFNIQRAVLCLPRCSSPKSSARARKSGRQFLSRPEHASQPPPPQGGVGDTVTLSMPPWGVGIRSCSRVFLKGGGGYHRVQMDVCTGLCKRMPQKSARRH